MKPLAIAAIATLAACTPPPHSAEMTAPPALPDGGASVADNHATLPTTTTTATTAPRPRPTTTVRASRERTAVSVPRAEGGDVLERIAQCESGGSYTAQNPTSTASGKYQVIDGTWGGYGGYRRAADAPPEVQEAHARELLARAGTRPWNASRRCWG